MAQPRRLVLVGFMGSGKSTLGPRLAARLGWDFLDMDRLLEERMAATIAEVFATRGEAAFREEERRLAVEIARRARCVVAAGGGAFAQPETRELLRADAVTVWLRCDLKTVLARVAGDPARPLAANREKIAALFAERDFTYALADAIVSTDRSSPDQATDAVMAAWMEQLKHLSEPAAGEA